MCRKTKMSKMLYNRSKWKGLKNKMIRPLMKALILDIHPATWECMPQKLVCWQKWLQSPMATHTHTHTLSYKPSNAHKDTHKEKTSNNYWGLWWGNVNINSPPVHWKEITHWHLQHSTSLLMVCLPNQTLNMICNKLFHLRAGLVIGISNHYS